MLLAVAIPLATSLPCIGATLQWGLQDVLQSQHQMQAWDCYSAKQLLCIGSVDEHTCMCTQSMRPQQVLAARTAVK